MIGRRSAWSAKRSMEAGRERRSLQAGVQQHEQRQGGFLLQPQQAREPFASGLVPDETALLAPLAPPTCLAVPPPLPARVSASHDLHLSAVHTCGPRAASFGGGSALVAGSDLRCPSPPPSPQTPSSLGVLSKGRACLWVTPACPASCTRSALGHCCTYARCSTLLVGHSVNISLWRNSCHYHCCCCCYCDSCTCHTWDSVVLAGQAVVPQLTTLPSISSANKVVLLLATITPQLSLVPAICTPF